MRRVAGAGNQESYNECTKFKMLVRHLSGNTKKSFSEQNIFKWGPDLYLINVYYKALVLNT